MVLVTDAQLVVVGATVIRLERELLPPGVVFPPGARKRIMDAIADAVDEHEARRDLVHRGVLRPKEA